LEDFTFSDILLSRSGRAYKQSYNVYPRSYTLPRQPEFPPEIKSILGGRNSISFHKFVHIALKAFHILRQNVDVFYSILIGICNHRKDPKLEQFFPSFSKSDASDKLLQAIYSMIEVRVHQLPIHIVAH